MKRLVFLLLSALLFAQEVGYTRMGIYAVREGEGSPSLYIPMLKALVKWTLEYGYKPRGPMRIEFRGVALSRKFRLMVKVNIPGIFPPRTSLSTEFVFLRPQHIAVSEPFSASSPPSAGDFIKGLKKSGWEPSSPPFLYLRNLGELREGKLRWAVEVKRRGNFQVGIYSDRGAFHLGLIASQRFFQTHGITYSPLYKEDLKRKDLYSRMKLIYFPGGWSGYYTEDLKGKAARMIRAFVEKGGRYLGVCAGAYFASREIIWEGKKYHPPLGIYPGVAVGPITSLAPWPLYTVAEVLFEGRKLQAFYYGGPYFVGEGEVLGRYLVNEKPAVILYRYGEGKVLLSGLHFEYELTGREDGVEFPENEGFKTANPTWPVFEKMIKILLEE